MWREFDNCRSLTIRRVAALRTGFEPLLVDPERPNPGLECGARNAKTGRCPGAAGNAPAGLGQCALTTTFLDFDNNEPLNNNGDVVLWYRGGAFHASGALDTCAIVGPTLIPLGNWTY